MHGMWKDSGKIMFFPATIHAGGQDWNKSKKLVHTRFTMVKQCFAIVAFPAFTHSPDTVRSDGKQVEGYWSGES